MENTERTKLYIVIGLAVLFVLVGYFRFFHGKGAAPAPVQPSSAVATVGPTTVPPVDLRGLRSDAGLPKSMSPPRASLRNIFAPVEKAPATIGAAGESAVTPLKPLPTLQLTGTIIGGKRPLAIVNGRFLRPGESIEGLQVLSIARNQVVLSAEGRKMVLNVLDGKEKEKGSGGL